MDAGVCGTSFQTAFDGSLLIHDTEVERRPYHRYCNCELHKPRGVCSDAQHKRRNISFPWKQEMRSDCPLSMTASKFSSPLCHSSIADRTRVAGESSDPGYTYDHDAELRSKVFKTWKSLEGGQGNGSKASHKSSSVD